MEKARDGAGAETAEGAQDATDVGAKADAEVKVLKAGNKVRSGKGIERGEKPGTMDAAEPREGEEVAGTACGQMSSKNGSDGEVGSRPVPGTEPGDPPAVRGLQNFVGEVLKVAEGQARKQRVAKAGRGGGREGAKNGAGDAGMEKDGLLADADKGGAVKGIAGGPRKESCRKGLESVPRSPALSPPIKATDRPSTAGTRSTPRAEAAAPEEDPRSAQPGSKALAENQPGDPNPLACEKKRSGTEKPSGQPSAEEAGGAIREGDGNLVARKKALRLAAKSTEVAGKGDPAGGVSVKAAEVESARTEEESASAALRGGAVKAVGKGADVDAGRGSDVNAGLDADVVEGGRADVSNEGDDDVESDRSADAPTKKDLLAAIELELRERERVIEASASLGGSPAEKLPKHSLMPQPAVPHLENGNASLISGGPDVVPGAADVTGRSGADHSEERVPAADGKGMNSPTAQPDLRSKERTDVVQRVKGLESGDADVTTGGRADGTKGGNAPEKKGNNGGEQEDDGGGSGAQGHDSRESSGEEAPRPAIRSDQAGPSQQATGNEVQTVVADAKGKAPAVATCQADARPATGSPAEQLPSAASYGSLWKAYADKLSEPESRGPSEERGGGASSAFVGVLQERRAAIPEPWAEIVGALRGLIRVTEESGRVVAARLDTLLQRSSRRTVVERGRGPKQTGPLLLRPERRALGLRSGKQRLPRVPVRSRRLPPGVVTSAKAVQMRRMGAMQRPESPEDGGWGSTGQGENTERAALSDMTFGCKELESLSIKNSISQEGKWQRILLVQYTARAATTSRGRKVGDVLLYLIREVALQTPLTRT
ncbi:hypothetical protein KFL_006950060 [Klebsormidium nitens]|uniref:Uncharacterized protein n=1 Tax=Klebsormidium nitens TaxID=105231 RepID=A0A1Y1INX0_KLENI|nr:hypothetical protein KFL_006950060 [Klebsormidium nitens]|eukprot:GAQ90871.1 hypothetical protein KFL_006950060 [Klebsormidium nitens]